MAKTKGAPSGGKGKGTVRGKASPARPPAAGKAKAQAPPARSTGAKQSAQGVIATPLVPRAQTAKAGKGTGAGKPATMPTKAHAKLASADVQAVLNGVHQVLAGQNITQPVQVHFTAADDGPCFEFRQIIDEDGNHVLRKFQIPCPEQ